MTRSAAFESPRNENIVLPSPENNASDQDNASDQFRLLSLSADIGRALTTRRTIAEMLHGCVEAMVTHLDAAFARVWLLDEAENMLVLKASAGLYTHLDGPHGRIPLGQFKIGRIAQERRPHLTNSVVGDPQVSDQEWAAREGMIAFAGYPLVLDARLVGVIALFARHPLSDATLQALGAVADQIAVGIERVRTEEALRESAERLRASLSASGTGTFRWDIRTNAEDWDENLSRLFGLPPGETAQTLESFLALIHPDDRAEAALLCRLCAAEGADFDRAFRVIWPDGSIHWLDQKGKVFLDAAGAPSYMIGAVQDITERLRRERRDQFLAALAERARSLTDPEEVIADAVRSVGEFLGVTRCIFADIDIEADTCTIHASEYRADPASPSIAGVVSIASFGAFVVAEYAARRAVAVDDVRLDPLRAPAESLAAYEAIGIRAHVTVPVVHYGRIVSCMSVHNSAPRQWKPEEIELLRAVVERTWLTVEVTRQDYALMREAAATTRILESITDAFMTFDHDWRFTYINDQSERVMSRTREELLGRSFWDEFPEAVGSTFEREYRRAVDEQTVVTFEEFYPPLGVWVEVRAYPSPDGLSVFYQDVSERKAMEIERERLAERERNIATHLQEALQPPLPEFVPGLAIGSFTRPALQEAQIGGDFFDIFPLDKELYALVIGDVSGKGLAAAQQLALVRNSLRTTLYLSRTPALAVSSLNAILTAHDLLVGFVTAFVGVYDASTGIIAYASCGHEPGLVRRRGGTVEELEPTGPPLGVDQNAAYGEAKVTLASGDALLLYTDGLPESGPSRRELLGTSGLIRLLESLPDGTDVQAGAEALVAGVSAYAGGVFRDDVAVLLAQRC